MRSVWDQSEAVADFSCFSIVSPEKQVHKISTWAPCRFHMRSHQALNEVSECLNSCVSFWSQAETSERSLYEIDLVSSQSPQFTHLRLIKQMHTISTYTPYKYQRRSHQALNWVSDCLNSCVSDFRQRHQGALFMKLIYSHPSLLNSSISSWPLCKCSLKSHPDLKC